MLRPPGKIYLGFGYLGIWVGLLNISYYEYLAIPIHMVEWELFVPLTNSVKI